MGVRGMRWVIFAFVLLVPSCGVTFHAGPTVFQRCVDLCHQKSSSAFDKDCERKCQGEQNETVFGLGIGGTF